MEAGTMHKEVFKNVYIPSSAAHEPIGSFRPYELVKLVTQKISNSYMLKGALSLASTLGIALLLRAACRQRYCFEGLSRELRRAIADISQHGSWDTNAACILLSGGLDSSIIAEVWGRHLGIKTAFTLICSDGECQSRKSHQAATTTTGSFQAYTADSYFICRCFLLAVDVLIDLY